jgi:hypothetical protein
MLVGVGFLVWIAQSNKKSMTEEFVDREWQSELRLQHMLRESISFMGLGLALRIYQSLPSILVGRQLGFEVVGILGAFLRIEEIVALPFTVIGNALKVRAQEIKSRGIRNINDYWDMLSRFLIVAMSVVLAFWFVAPDVAKVLLPKSTGAAKLFSIMAPLIFLRTASDLFAPASDYVGGLRSRIVFLLLCALLQPPLIWIAIHLQDARGTWCNGRYHCLANNTSDWVYNYCKACVFWANGIQTTKRCSCSDFCHSRCERISVIDYIKCQNGHDGVFTGGFLCFPLLRRHYASGKFMRFELI